MSEINVVADLITLSLCVINNIRCQNYSDAAIGQKKLVNDLSGLFIILPDELIEQLKTILVELLSAQEKSDNILLADILELEMLPFLSNYQLLLLDQEQVTADEDIYETNIKMLEICNSELAALVRGNKCWSDNVVVEYSSSGYLTFKLITDEGELYFHSNGNPKLESSILAREYYDIDIDDYVVYGLGFGYHINSLLDIDDGINVDIIEPRLDVICAAMHFVDLRSILMNERVRIIYDPNYKKVSGMIDANKKLLVHYPTMKNIQDKEIKLALQKFFIHESGVRKYRVIFKNNFRENIKNMDHYVDELKPSFADKNAVLVAAGPSLDKNVHLLKKLLPDVLIVAVGTVFNKLMNLGIKPDYVVVLDSQEHTANQFKNQYDNDVPVIIASTAVKEVAKKYKGKKYLVCQNGYDKAQQYAKEHKYMLYETGGSVSTIALDICIRLGCKEIACIGLDLAYTDDRTHSEDTNFARGIDSEDSAVDVKAVDGGMVKASRVFVIYREWMERRVKEKDAKGKLIDATGGGALIEGFRIEDFDSVVTRFSM